MVMQTFGDINLPIAVCLQTYASALGMKFDLLVSLSLPQIICRKYFYDRLHSGAFLKECERFQ